MIFLEQRLFFFENGDEEAGAMFPIFSSRLLVHTHQQPPAHWVVARRDDNCRRKVTNDQLIGTIVYRREDLTDRSPEVARPVL